MIDILLVEDNPTDVLMVRKAIEYIGLNARVHWLEQGDELLPFLRDGTARAGKPQPHVILLDVGLPGRDGLEILGELKADPNLQHIPVLMLTASADQADVERAFRLQAACYIVKPPTFDALVDAMRAVGTLWGPVDRAQGGRRP